MYCSIKRNAMLSLRTVLAALIGSLVLMCFAQPAAPQVNIEIMVIDGADHVKISWERVEGAETYNIYSSYDPYTQGWGDPIASVGDSVFTYTTEDSVDELGSAYFFFVTAYTPEEELMVLVDGDLFNGNVHIDPFYISKYQVTQAEYQAVMGHNPSNFHVGEVAHLRPVERVSWFNAIEYCNRLSIREGLTPAYSYLGRSNPDDWYEQLPGWNEVSANHTNVSCDWEADGYRLPTEAEWNHAANAGIHPPPFTYSGSNDVNEVAWYSGNSGGTSHPVGELAPNGHGIYDMSGNVDEWVWDRWGGTFPSGNDNPRGNGTHITNRVRRGGSWIFNTSYCAVSYRSNSYATARFNSIGFRFSRIIP